MLLRIEQLNVVINQNKTIIQKRTINNYVIFPVIPFEGIVSSSLSYVGIEKNISCLGNFKIHYIMTKDGKLGDIAYSIYFFLNKITCLM